MWVGWFLKGVVHIVRSLCTLFEKHRTHMCWRVCQHRGQISSWKRTISRHSTSWLHPYRPRLVIHVADVETVRYTANNEVYTAVLLAPWVNTVVLLAQWVNPVLLLAQRVVLTATCTSCIAMMSLCYFIVFFVSGSHILHSLVFALDARTKGILH